MSEGEAALRVDIVTIFPEMVRAAAGCSILGRAQTAGRLDLHVHDLRDHTEGRHRQTDDYPFGGGAGMVMMPGPLFTAIETILADAPETPVLLMAPDGERFDQAMARELAALPRYMMVCGHYEGIDERVREGLVTRSVSIGDYVLTGGELPALVILDATARLLPGVLGNEASAADETFGGADEGLLLEYPHYTRPAVFREMTVPDVLLSGHHANIAKWRRQQALIRTRARAVLIFGRNFFRYRRPTKNFWMPTMRRIVRRTGKTSVVVFEPVSRAIIALPMTAGGCAESSNYTNRRSSDGNNAECHPRY